MYESFFGLTERPFDLTPNPRYLVLTDSHREVLSTLEYGIGSRKGITLLVGEAGSGKTTLIRAAMEKQPTRVHCVHIQNPTLTREEFVETLAVRFGLSQRAGQSKAALLSELEHWLRERRAQDETTVLIVDEAQSLPLALLEEIRLLANIETASEKLVSVILAGQPELAQRLNETDLRQLKQRVALRCELRPLTEQEAAGYIAGRIRIAGGSGAQVFTHDAVSLMYSHARGIPRTISVIADNAMLGGFAAGERPVSSRIVREVCADFDLTPGAAHRVPHVSTHGATKPAAAPELLKPVAKPAAPRPELLSEFHPTEGKAESKKDDAEDSVKPDDASEQVLFGTFSSRRKRFSFFGS